MVIHMFQASKPPQVTDLARCDVTQMMTRDGAAPTWFYRIAQGFPEGLGMVHS